MNPILNSVYGAILPSAPYVIAAYALVWVILFVFVAVIARGIKKNNAEIKMLKHAINNMKDAHDDKEQEG